MANRQVEEGKGSKIVEIKEYRHNILFYKYNY